MREGGEEAGDLEKGMRPLAADGSCSGPSEHKAEETPPTPPPAGRGSRRRGGQVAVLQVAVSLAKIP